MTSLPENEGVAVARTEPYIWVTWLTKLLTGDDSCEWAAWFRTHYERYDQVPSTFDQATWQMNHNALMGRIRENLDAEGYAVFTERQNAFTLRGSSRIALGGRPDFIATRDGEGLIIDAKTGQPRPSDSVQVMIYMWAIPLGLKQYRGVTFNGKVIYSDHEVPVPNQAINETFTSNLVSMIRRVGGRTALHKVPSAMECSFCPIASTECPDRIEDGSPQEVETEEF